MTEYKPSHAIFIEWPLGRNSGGPSGYLWHLRSGLERAGMSHLIKFVAPSEPPSRPLVNSRVAKIVDSAAGVSDSLWRLLKTYGPTTVSRERREYISGSLSDFVARPDWEALLGDKDYRSFHCHTSLDCLRVHNSLSRLGRRDDVLLFLTLHCPEMPALEKLEVMKNNGLSKRAEKAVLNRLLEIDVGAISCADRMIFPCAEALDPYRETFPAIESFLDPKKISYVLTGIGEPARESLSPEIFKGKEDRLKMLYIGRHNEVKGYDFLSKAVPPLLDCYQATMIVAGSQGPLFAPKHPHWVELGWISNAQDVIAQSDVFLLPNARTYFDLVALEVMAHGVPVLASKTGGNKKLAALSAGVILFDRNEEAFAAAIKEFMALPRDKRLALGKMNRAAYDKFFTVETFARNYVAQVLYS